MMAKKLILFPCGGNGREAVMAVEAINKNKPQWDVLGFIDDDSSLKGKECCGIKVLGGREILPKYPGAFVLAVPGNPRNYLERQAIIDRLAIEPSRFTQVIHPSVIAASDVRIGYNTLIMAGVVITTNVTIGNHCVILPNTTVSHDSVIGDYSCIGSQVAVSGAVKIGENCYIGSGTTLRNGITVGDKTLVGIGSNVVKDIGEGLVVAGNPARPLGEKVK